MKKNFLKKSITVILAAMMLMSSLTALISFAGEEDYLTNSHYITISADNMVAKILNGDKFIGFISDDGSDSKEVGAEIVEGWMNEKGKDIYGIYIHPDEGEEIPEFVWDYVPLDIEFIQSPVVLFVENKEVSIFTSKTDTTYDDLTKKFNEFYPPEAKTVTGISIKNYPDKLLYRPGEELKTNGLAISLNYSDGTSDSVYSGYTVSKVDMSTEEVKKVTIDYNGWKTDYEITVSNSLDYTFRFRFDQADARTMLDDINKLRSESPWYWNEDNETKTYPQCSALTYSYDLEAAAMQRAVELIANYAHTRPNGLGFSTIIKHDGYVMSENIAYGYANADDMFNLGWKQEDKDYEGQGHRRNMIDEEMNTVGIACVSYTFTDPATQNDIDVKFWVQLFSTDTKVGTKTDYSESFYEGEVTILNTSIYGIDAVTSVESYELNCGDNVALPGVTAKIRIVKPAIFAYDIVHSVVPKCEWQTENSAVAKIENGRLVATGEGQTNIYAGIGLDTIYVPVTVKTQTVQDEDAETELSSSIESYEIKMSDRKALPTVTAVVTPKTGEPRTSYPDCIWTSENEAIAKIEEGKVVGVAIGETNITTSYNGKTLIIPVKVVDYVANSTASVIGSQSISLIFGKSTAAPAVKLVSEYASGKTETTYPTCKWISANKEIADISEGNVVAVSLGNTEIYADVSGSRVTVPVTVSDEIVSSSYQPQVSLISLKVGSSANLPFIVKKDTYASGKENTVNISVNWASGNPSVARINGVKIAAVSAGSTYIQSSIDRNIFNVNVNVEENITPPPTVSIGGAAAGSTKDVKVDYKSTVICKAAVKNPSEGISIRWYVDGSERTDFRDEPSIKLTAVQKQCSIQAAIYEGGSKICESGTVKVIPDTGFFAKLIAFFRGLFKSLPIINI